MNDYFSGFTALPVNQLARAEAVNAIFQSVIGGFNLLPGRGPLTEDRITYCGADTGVANVYVITPTIPISQYNEGAQFSFKASNANTGGSTLNVSGLGAIALKRQDLTDLVAGDITAGMIVQVRYDGTRFQLTSLPGSSVALASASAANAAASATAAANSATAAANSATAAAASAASIGPTGTVQIGKLGIGMAPVNILDITQTQNANSIVKLLNASTGNAASAHYSASNGTNEAQLHMIGTGYSTSGVVRADGALLTSGGAGGVTVNTGAAQPIYFGINNTEKMRLDASGNLLINTTSNPSNYKLMVNGNASISGITLGNGISFAGVSLNADTGSGASIAMTGFGNGATINYNGSISSTDGNGLTMKCVSGGVVLSNGATAWAALSDIRVKTDIKPIRNALDRVSRLRPVTYKYKTDKAKARRRVGLIAQHAQKAQREAVTKGKDGFLMLSLTEMVPLSFAAISELLAEHRALKARVAKLERKAA